MTPKKVTPQDLKAQEAGPNQARDHELGGLGGTCPTCLSGIEASTLDPKYLEILKR
ncbi:MAG: hypothetical protein AAGM22_12730 [Acidobacteriota bacterium]